MGVRVNDAFRTQTADHWREAFREHGLEVVDYDPIDQFHLPASMIAVDGHGDFGAGGWVIDWVA